MRAAPAIIGAVVASSIAATAAGDPLGFWQTNSARSPMDITPGGALAASSTFIRGSLRCADNVNAMLRANGYRGTGSRAARSFLAYGKPVSGPRPGAIQVERRGWNPAAGHVQIVSHQRGDGTWMCKNPSSRVGAWVMRPCANPRVIAYRMPTAADVIGGRMLAGKPASPQRVMTANAPIPANLTFGAGIVPASAWSAQAFTVLP
jgi:hypothetical protein